MGLVYADLEISNINKIELKKKLSFLVDTGAINTVVPKNFLNEIGVKKIYNETYELANGTHIKCDVGSAYIYINGKTIATNVVFGENNTEPLLGVTVLESAGLLVDPVNKTLKKTDAISLKLHKQTTQQ